MFHRKFVASAAAVTLFALSTASFGQVAPSPAPGAAVGAGSGGAIGATPNNSFIGSGIGPSPSLNSGVMGTTTPFIGSTPLVGTPPTIGTTLFDSGLGNSSAGPGASFGITTPMAPITPSQPVIGGPRICPNGMTVC